MQDDRHLIAENITFLRKSVKLTQAELAEKLNYSDKAVSKWERAESIPDVLVLKRIAELFSVSLDFFFEAHDPKEEKPKIEAEKQKTHLAVTLTACIAVFGVALLVYVILRFSLPDATWPWKVFIAALPALCIVYLVFQALWGKKKCLIFIAISCLLWSTCATVFVFLYGLSLSFEPAELFFIGIPVQLIILVWAFFILRKKKRL